MPPLGCNIAEIYIMRDCIYRMQPLEKFGPKAYEMIKIELITEIINSSSEPVQYIVHMI